MLQKLLFDYSPICKDAPGQAKDVKALFWRGAAQSAEGALALKGGALVTFDTYFNMFSALKWKEYTTAEKVALKLILKGKGKVMVCGAMLSEPDREIVLRKADYDFAQMTEFVPFCAKLSGSPDFLYFKIKAEIDSLIYSGGWDAEIKNPARVKIAACICTYRREAELKENIKKIKEQIFEDASSPLNESLDVYIADNGHTLKDIPFFTDAVKTYQNRLFIFENKNCGGSAGFTRCMIEAVLKKDAGYTHVLLMDDDADVEPFTLERTQALLSALKEENRDKFVGGAFLSQARKTLQLEYGCGCGCDCFISETNKNILISKFALDLSLKTNIFMNEKFVLANFCCFYYCCIPVKHITRKNLPLPLFIHEDDIEYGIRCGGIDVNQAITLNGLCIWHPERTLKQPEYIGYYDGRNHSIESAEFFADMTFGEVKRKAARTIFSLALRYSYTCALYAIRGIRAFYESIDAFKSIDGEALNTKLRGEPTSQVALKASQEEIKRLLPPSRYGHMARVARKLLTWALPAVRGRAYYDKDCPGDGVDYFLRKELVFVDRETGDAVLIKKSYRQLLRVVREYFRLMKLVKPLHDSVWRQWHERIGELQTLDFWERYLELS